MQADPSRVDRRQLVRDIGAGVAAGVLLGVGFLAADRWLRNPAVAIVGHAESQAALVMTPTRHILLAMGPWNDELVDAIVPLMGWSNRKLDLVVAAEQDSILAQNWTSSRRMTRQLVLVSNSKPAGFSAAENTIYRAMDVQLDTDVRLVLEPAHPLATNDGSAAFTPWTALIHRGLDRIWLIERTSGLEFVSPAHPPTILAVPDGEALAASTTFNARAIASNVDTWMQSAGQSLVVDEVSSPIAIVRTFPREPAIFEFVDAGIRVPTWTREIAQPDAQPGTIRRAQNR